MQSRIQPVVYCTKHIYLIIYAHVRYTTYISSIIVVMPLLRKNRVYSISPIIFIIYNHTFFSLYYPMKQDHSLQATSAARFARRRIIDADLSKIYFAEYTYSLHLSISLASRYVPRKTSGAIRICNGAVNIQS